MYVGRKHYTLMGVLENTGIGILFYEIVLCLTKFLALEK